MAHEPTLRFGFRLLRPNPLFAITAILSLALGIAANTAIFQLIDAVRLRTLPVHNPQEIARVALHGGWEKETVIGSLWRVAGIPDDHFGG